MNCSTIWYISKQRIMNAINESVYTNGYYLSGSPLLNVQVILREEGKAKIKLSCQTFEQSVNTEESLFLRQIFCNDVS